MSDQLRIDLHTMMRNARAQFEADRPFDQLSEVATVVDDYLAAKARLESIAAHARALRQPPAQPVQSEPAKSGRPLMPHENYDGMDGGGNPYLREALLRKGD